MKLTILLCVSAMLCLSAFSSADNALPVPRAPDCSLYVDDKCPHQPEVLCGTDGETYFNECVLCIENRNRQPPVLISYMGECIQP